MSDSPYGKWLPMNAGGASPENAAPSPAVTPAPMPSPASGGAEYTGQAQMAVTLLVQDKRSKEMVPLQVDMQRGGFPMALVTPSGGVNVNSTIQNPFPRHGNQALVLDSTRRIEVCLAGAITTNQPEYYAAYSDVNEDGLTEGATEGAFNSTTDVNAVVGPSAGTIRCVYFLSIYNKDTVSCVATVKIYNGTAERIICKRTLQADETLTITPQGISIASPTLVNSVTAGNGLSGGGSGAVSLDVNVDNSSIEINSDALRVKAAGITNAMLAGSIDLTSKVTGALPIANGGTGAATALANLIFAGPTTGAAAAPSFRALVTDDVSSSMITLPKVEARARWNMEAIINGGFPLLQRGSVAGYTPAHGDYGLDRFYSVSESATNDVQHIRIDESGNALNSYYSGQIKNNNAATKRIGLCQVVESHNSIVFRGRAVRFQGRVKTSTSRNIRAAIIAWTGTKDTFTTTTRNPVNTWTSTTYTNNNFFKSNGSGYKVVGVSAQVAASSAGYVDFSVTSADNSETSNVVPTDCNNLILIVWDDAGAPTTGTINLMQLSLNDGVDARIWLPRPIGLEVALCQRYYEKSYAVDTAPTSSAFNNGIQYAIVGASWANGGVASTTCYRVSKRNSSAAITIRPYTTHTNTGRVSDANTGTDFGASSGQAIAPTERGFVVQNATGGALAPSSNAIMFHWEAENEL